MQKTALFYDITRLIKRRHSTTPSGVDNVDIAYAKFLSNCTLDTDTDDRPLVRFVAQRGSGIHVLCTYDATRFIKKLDERWLTGQSGRLGIPKFKRDLLLTNKKSRLQYLLKSLIKDAQYYYSQTVQFKPKVFLFGLLNWLNLVPQLIKLPVLTLVAIALAPIMSLVAFFRRVCQCLYQPDASLEGRLLYVNVAQIGIDKSNLFKQMKDSLGFHFAFYVHDLIPISHPEYVVKGSEIAHRKRMLAIAGMNNTTLFFNSLFTKMEFDKFCRVEKVDCNTCIENVLPIGVDENVFHGDFEIERLYRFGLVDIDYFVCIGTIEPRKNHALLLNIWKKMVVDNHPTIPKLVLIGKRGWLNQHIVYELERSSLLKEHVVEFNDISNKDLALIMKNARALLFPSLIEGWGMPLVEALTSKIPVICSDTPIFREAGQNLAVYCSPYDAISWEKEIYRFLDSEYRQKQISNISQFQVFSWGEHFAQFLKQC